MKRGLGITAVTVVTVLSVVGLATLVLLAISLYEVRQVRAALERAGTEQFVEFRDIWTPMGCREYVRGMSRIASAVGYPMRIDARGYAMVYTDPKREGPNFVYCSGSRFSSFPSPLQPNRDPESVPLPNLG